MAQSELAAEDVQLLGRPKPQYTYSRKSDLKKKKRLSSDVDLSDNEHNGFQKVLYIFYKLQEPFLNFLTFFFYIRAVQKLN